MGYTTYFDGTFALDRKLTKSHADYLRAFTAIRHMRRDNKKLSRVTDPFRKAVKLPLGEEGEFFIGEPGTVSSGHVLARKYTVYERLAIRDHYRHPSVLDINEAPSGVPGLYCGWTVGEDDQSVVWDEGEKFYSYLEWLDYLVSRFLAPWGYTLNGSCVWSGEDSDDVGTLLCRDNVVTSVDVTPSLIARVASALTHPEKLAPETKLVIRDAFLEGKDDHAIGMLLEALVGILPKHVLMDDLIRRQS